MIQVPWRTHEFSEAKEFIRVDLFIRRGKTIPKVPFLVVDEEQVSIADGFAELPEMERTRQSDFSPTLLHRFVIEFNGVLNLVSQKLSNFVRTRGICVEWRNGRRPCRLPRISPFLRIG